MNDSRTLPHSDLSRRVLGAAFEVHTHLGPGLLENSYRACLAHEMRLRGIPFVTEAPLSLQYKITPLHAAQVLTYLRLAQLPIGLLINFNVGSLRSGIRRIINTRAIED